MSLLVLLLLAVLMNNKVALDRLVMLIRPQREERLFGPLGFRVVHEKSFPLIENDRTDRKRNEKKNHQQTKKLAEPLGSALGKKSSFPTSVNLVALQLSLRSLDLSNEGESLQFFSIEKNN